MNHKLGSRVRRYAVSTTTVLHKVIRRGLRVISVDQIARDGHSTLRSNEDFCGEGCDRRQIQCLSLCVCVYIYTYIYIIMQGDLNCAHQGCRWKYAQPLNKDIGTADNKLENFLQNTSGCFHTQQEPTWQGKECRAALDHVITWNYHLPPQAARPIPKSYKKFDHCQVWTQLPHLDFPKQTNMARTTQPDFSQRIDTVFFKRHVDDWKVRIKSQIQGELEVNPTGQALADLIHKEQQILAKRGSVATG